MNRIFEEIKYGFRIIFHPFDGFYCGKFEKRISIKSSLILIFIFLITLSLRIINVGYIAKAGQGDELSPLLICVIALFVIVLYCVSNWSLTTLMDGKGTFFDIINFTAYALIPLILFNIPIMIISRVIIIEEMSMYSVVDGFSILWFVFLLLCANISVHDYTLVKTIFVNILTVFTMLIIIGLMVLFVNLIQQVYMFLLSLYSEVAFRV